MRTFSKFEQERIREIIEVNPLNSNIMDFFSNSILYERAIMVDEENQIVTFLIKKNDSNAVSEIFELISLIKYLEKEYLIFKHTKNTRETISGVQSKNLTAMTFNARAEEFQKLEVPTNIYHLLQNYRNSFMVVGTELKQLVKNNFQTSEEINHRREMKVAKRSFYVALIALVFSFLSPFLFDTTINPKQIKQIKNQLEKIQKSISS